MAYTLSRPDVRPRGAVQPICMGFVHPTAASQCTNGPRRCLYESGGPRTPGRPHRGSRSPTARVPPQWPIPVLASTISRCRGQTTGGPGCRPVYSRKTLSSQVVDLTRSPSPARVTLCWYHEKFGNTARKFQGGKQWGRSLVVMSVSGPQCSRLFYITNKITGTRFLVDTRAEVNVISPSPSDERQQADLFAPYRP